MRMFLIIGLLLIPLSAAGRTWNILEDGSGDAPTIQAGIDSSAVGDTILVGPGTYNENLDTNGKWLVLRSTTRPEWTIIKGGSDSRVVTLNNGGVVEGFTIRDGKAQNGGGILIDAQESENRSVIRGNIIKWNSVGFVLGSGDGGGIWVGDSIQDVLIEANVIRQNYAAGNGGGIDDHGIQTIIKDNIFVYNTCHLSGGGVRVEGAYVYNNLIIENSADTAGGGLSGGGIEIRNNSVVDNYVLNIDQGAGIVIDHGTPLVANNIVAFNYRFGPGGTRGDGGFGIDCNASSGTPRLECNDFWGNSGDDFRITNCDTLGAQNFSLDPLFCNPSIADLTISSDSPCAPGGYGNCGLIGADPVQCPGTPVLKVTWGRIKAKYN